MTHLLLEPKAEGMLRLQFSEAAFHLPLWLHPRLRDMHNSFLGTNQLRGAQLTGSGRVLAEGGGPPEGQTLEPLSEGCTLLFSNQSTQIRTCCQGCKAGAAIPPKPQKEERKQKQEHLLQAGKKQQQSSPSPFRTRALSRGPGAINLGNCHPRLSSRLQTLEGL